MCCTSLGATSCHEVEALPLELTGQCYNKMMIKNAEKYLYIFFFTCYQVDQFLIITSEAVHLLKATMNDDQAVARTGDLSIDTNHQMVCNQRCRRRIYLGYNSC